MRISRIIKTRTVSSPAQRTAFQQLLSSKKHRHGYRQRLQTTATWETGAGGGGVQARGQGRVGRTKYVVGDEVEESLLSDNDSDDKLQLRSGMS